MSAPSTDGRGAAGAARSESRGVRLDPALRAELDALYADYAAALDEARWDDWIALFADDCSYLLQPRENHDRGLPLATMRLESKGMLRDRIVGITETLFHAPYYQRHVIGPLRVLAAGTTDGVEHVDVQAAYAVHRTRRAKSSTSAATSTAWSATRPTGCSGSRPSAWSSTPRTC
jgi:salicylate 5-hydroxylase small subunit